MPDDQSPLLRETAVSEAKPANAGGPTFPFPVVGAGASAGGLDALTRFLKELPTDTGMAFVIVQHLAPERESGLAEILSRATAMPVSEVQDEPLVVPDHVYVIPPGRDMFIAGGKLRLLPQDRQAQNRGIDQFFRSLAEECGHKAIGVVLSGGLNDGTVGVEAIKAAGGITFAQDESARNESMPRSAVASGWVDFVLSPEEIAGEIARIARHPYVAPQAESSRGAKEEPNHSRIAEILHRTTGVDFTHYKPNTLSRRITRRMVLRKLETLEDYEKHLEQTPGEVEALFQDILIPVTRFFRDPEAFEALGRDVFPQLTGGRTRREPLRVWTLGCSTGQEAYSIAMALTECAERAGIQLPLQIFATDLNDTGVGVARAGVYPKSIADEVSPERLRRFFTEQEDGYRICKSIREQCIFSRHNVLGDPPFSKVDFISCRNVLIYMEPVLQQQIMPLLHYALKPGGFLWLGSSETAGNSRDLFAVKDARHKIYVRQPGTSPTGATFRPRGVESTGDRSPARGRSFRDTPRVDLSKEAERILLSRYAPPGVVVSRGMEIVQFRGDTGAYLSPAPGVASLQLLKMLREGLLIGVRAAILQAGEKGSPVREEGLRVKCEGGFREVAVEVIPIKAGESKEGGFLVLFDEGGRATPAIHASPGDIRDAESNELSRLTQELLATREYLQSVIEQQESVNEELQSANEEAQSANEEMQSVNEELETSKEEIQSSNEELATVNEELNTRNVELHRLNGSLALARDYAESIVASVRSPLVVLGAELRVKTASAAFYETFRVSPETTEGRLIYDLGNGQWNIPALRTLLEELLPQEERIDGFEVCHTFEQIGPRTMLLNARQLAVGPENEPLIVMGIEDITERRAEEDSLAARATDLVRADRSKDEFLAMLAHELRNPLAPMRNAAEILSTPAADEGARTQAQRVLSRQIGNMSRMIDDLLDISRITEGKIELCLEVVELHAIFNAAASIVRPDVEARGQELTIMLPTDPIYLSADPIRLDQVFGNLLGNASKYSGSGSHISLVAERAELEEGGPAGVIVRVLDDGIGMPAELLPHIFELFVQATRAPDRAYGGLGIGLTLVQRLVKLHGGSIEARSAGPGEGSEFIVRLPVFPGPAVAPPPAITARERPLRMLIVDDNRDAAETMAMLQELRGHQTLTAHAGADAIIAAAAFLPEVVLLDIGLPGMDGFEVARRLRAMPALAGSFLVALTGCGSEEDRERAKEAGFDEHLVKPANLELLREWLRSRVGPASSVKC
jgi:two-component system CheB/CheR fusion protein